MLKQNNPQYIPKPISKSSDFRYRYYDCNTEVYKYIFLYFKLFSIKTERSRDYYCFINTKQSQLSQ